MDTVSQKDSGAVNSTSVSGGGEGEGSESNLCVRRTERKFIVLFVAKKSKLVLGRFESVSFRHRPFLFGIAFVIVFVVATYVVGLRKKSYLINLY